MPPYSLEYLLAQPTIKETKLGALKEQSPRRRVYLKIDCIVEENIEGRWIVTEIYTPA